MATPADVCPPNGIILDMFAGSGTGCIAALADGYRWIGIELLRKHVQIAKARIIGDAPLLNWDYAAAQVKA